MDVDNGESSTWKGVLILGFQLLAFALSRGIVIEMVYFPKNQGKWYFYLRILVVLKKSVF